uniref:Myopalladin n=1 Tax=Sphaeramia orbicularis TaxID=375764 RepID=A0A673AQG0_9TELE
MFLWFCEGKELENSPDIQIITNGELHSLIIAEAFEEDTGRYSCFASNYYGTDSTSAEIYVEGGFHVCFILVHRNSHVQVLMRNYFLLQQVPLPPRSAPCRGLTLSPLSPQNLQDLLASEGQLVVLECRVKGTPSPRVDWYREGKPIEDSPDFRILQKKPRSPAESEEICTLVIAEVFPEDSGMFTCTASNKYGTVSSTAALRVKGKVSHQQGSHLYLELQLTINDLMIEKPQPASPDMKTPKAKGTPNGTPFVIPLPDPPPNSCLKSGNGTNHKQSRSGSRVGLRVHFKLPEDEEQSDPSSQSDEDGMQASISKEPPPVFAKPKLDPAQLQLLHNQVLLEQQQDTDPPTRTQTQPPPPTLPQAHPPIQVQIQPEVQSSHEPSPVWSPRIHREPPQIYTVTTAAAPPPATAPPAPILTPTPAPILTSTPTPILTSSPAPILTSIPLNSSATSSPTLPPFSPPPRIFPTRVLQSPTSPPSLVSSPTPGSASLLNSVFAFRAQSPPQASSPTSSSSTPSPIQNPVAFLSSVLPSLTLCHPTNSMGLPKGAPAGVLKKTPKVHLPSNEEIRESKESLLIDIEKKLRFKDDSPQYEYKVSSFEQRLMSEIEFRLERTPVEESDDEVQHDDIPTGKCIAPIFDKKLKNFRAMEGVPVTFSCKVVGIPIPKVYWFKDGKQILRKNIHYKRIREGDGTCALHIESVTNDDDGNYTIMAANPQGRISCSGHLIVQTGPPRNRMTPIHPQRVRARIQEVENEQTQERFFRPHFLQAPGDMMAHEGKLCRLDCKVSGLPSPELMWLVNGRPIYPDIYHKMLVRENGIHSLVIDPLTQNDAGTYTCIASNKAGQSSFSLELKVVEKEMKHPPQFVEKLQNMGIPEGTPVRMECRVLGMPPPLIFWKKDNDTIPRTKDRISMHQDATGYVCLLIQPTTKDDAGWYTVSAKNEAGIVSCTCRLDIYAQWHQNIPAPMKKTPRTGSRYAALTGQGLDIKSAFPTSENSPILFASSPPEATLESEEL